jgi:hypothetical protein
MVGPFATYSGMAIVLIATLLWQPLINALVKGSNEGFFKFCKSATQINN